MLAEQTIPLIGTSQLLSVPMPCMQEVVKVKGKTIDNDKWKEMTPLNGCKISELV
jgi:hypothetical protein